MSPRKGFTVKIIDSVRSIARSIMREFLGRTRKKLPQINKRAHDRIAELIRVALYRSVTVSSLLDGNEGGPIDLLEGGGSLRDDFGLTRETAATAVTNIVEAVSDKIEIDVGESQGGSAGRVYLNFLPAGLSPILSVTGASYTTEKGDDINWLAWLLLKGSQIIISDFALFENAEGQTRSGGSHIMIPLKNKKPFRVNPLHAGNDKVNFITRALEPIREDLTRIVLDEISRAV